MPVKIPSNGEQPTVQDAKPLAAAKIVRLKIGAASDKISAALAELVNRRVRPRDGWRVHEGTVIPRSGEGKFFLKAAQHCRTSKPGGGLRHLLDAAGFWRMNGR